MDWRVYDSRSARAIGKVGYSKQIAELLAKTANWAYQEGKKDAQA